MAKITWDRVTDRVYQNGLDQGVLYLDNGSAVPWNGLTAIVEKIENDVTAVYFDGLKISSSVVVGDFSATMRAVTYPREFEELESFSSDVQGVYYGNQAPKLFNLSYRTKIANALDSEFGYKIHVVYNLIAVPKEKAHASLNDSPSLDEFEWEIHAMPQEIPGHRPTAHIVIDSTKVDPRLLMEIEAILYGDNMTPAELPSMDDFVSFMRDWYLVKITDHGDGSWSATADLPGFITIFEDDSFEIEDVNAIYLDVDTYQISDTQNASDAPLIRFDLNADGSWTATTDAEDLIEIDEFGVFTIRNVNLDFSGPDMYRVSNS